MSGNQIETRTTRPARSRFSRHHWLQANNNKKKSGRKKERDPRTRAGLDGADGGGEDPRPDEVGEEAGEGQQEGVVYRDEQRRGPVAPALGRLLPRSGAEPIVLVHLQLPLTSPVPPTLCTRAVRGWSLDGRSGGSLVHRGRIEICWMIEEI
jgi:hypothetical protein